MLLALDTSTRTVGLALYDGQQVLGEFVWTSHDHHTVELAPAVSDLLSRCGTEIGQVEALAVALGPGSFTGLRIGLALAKGLALVRRIPIVGVPSLDILAEAYPMQDLPLAAVLRAGRGRLATGWYHAGKSGWEGQPRVEVLTAAELLERIETPTRVCGELTDEERRTLGRKRKMVLLASPAHSLRRPSFLAELGWRRWQSGQVDDAASLAPIYLHYNDPVSG